MDGRRNRNASSDILPNPAWAAGKMFGETAAAASHRSARKRRSLRNAVHMTSEKSLRDGPIARPTRQLRLLTEQAHEVLELSVEHLCHLADLGVVKTVERMRGEHIAHDLDRWKATI